MDNGILIVAAIAVVIAVVAVINLILVFSSRKDTILMQNQIQEIGRRLEIVTVENQKQLDQIRETVDEKLQRTLEDRISRSFQIVSDRLEQVHKGLGEMQSLATGVGDLKKVLSNVKTRGILGEIQLGAILEEILSPEQYEENIRTKSSGSERVEFAVKMPGDNTRDVYLPVDAKFPADAYIKLVDAYDTADKLIVEAAKKNLATAIKKAAKDIRDKYVEPPYTTDFAVMFLPFEGLYAEVVRMGMVEELQRDFKVNIAGPTTMAALLNSLQMGFKTVAIQKHTSDVWNILAATKTEFEKFESVIEKTQQRINQANEELDRLVGVRTRSINRTLKEITTLNSDKRI
ncbi:MAG: DNA recombination protein RmuC [Eubacterium sp.]|nr:DNA recombination protein RmuC [Eubacterium sp.]